MEPLAGAERFGLSYAGVKDPCLYHLATPQCHTVSSTGDKGEAVKDLIRRLRLEVPRNRTTVKQSQNMSSEPTRATIICTQTKLPEATYTYYNDCQRILIDVVPEKDIRNINVI